MIRDKLIDTAIRLGIDGQLRSIRATLHPVYRRQRSDNQNLRSLLQSTLTAYSNCIDVGAYRGRVLSEIVRVAPHGRHIAYEPLPHIHKYLVDHFLSVEVRLAAVSNEEGQTTFTYVKNMPACSGLHERVFAEKDQVEKLTVRTETLDRNLPVGYVPALIKIDVEGAERKVIEGGIETISKHKPIIIFEHGKGGASHYSTQPRHIYELLHEEAGLNIFDMDGNGPYSLDQLEEAFEKDERWDYVARP